VTEPLLRLSNVTKWFPSRQQGGKPVQAVSDVSLEVMPGEVVGLVGESGSGKSTIGQTITRLHDPDSGEISIAGIDFGGMYQRELRKHRRVVQMIFQDPSSSLNPRMRVGDIIEEGLGIHGLGGDAKARKQRVNELLELIGLPADFARRFPHQLSGGQRQRVGIARALAVEPSLLIADEAVSALDVSIQAQVISLLESLQKKLNLTMLFISHDMSVVEYISDRVAVLYLGRLVEVAKASEIFRRPLHPYTEALLSAIPTTNVKTRRKRILLEGDIPNPSDPPKGCVFSTRCPHVAEQCKSAMPPLVEVEPGRFSACMRQELFEEKSKKAEEA